MNLPTPITRNRLCLLIALLCSSAFFTACDQAPSEQPSQNNPISLDKEIIFNGSESDPISLELASTWTENYQNAHPGEIVAHYTGRDILRELLDQPTAKGIRIYRGLDEAGNNKMLFMAADDAGADLEGLVADFALPCPKLCDPEIDSPLLSFATGKNTPTTFDGSEGAPIALSQAQAWMGNYKQLHLDGVWGHFVGDQMLEELLAQKGAMGIRIYYAIGDAEEETVILVAVDASGHDMIDGLLAEYTSPCPPTCGPIIGGQK